MILQSVLFQVMSVIPILVLHSFTVGCVSLSHQADIAFLLDTSSSVYGPDFEKMKLFLADFIDLFNVSESRQRIASLTFSDEVKVNFYLSDYRNNRDVKVRMFLFLPVVNNATPLHLCRFLMLD